MKKYFIIAIAALAAGTACTKVETVEAPAQKIDFQVASYVPQTRADDYSGTSLLNEGCTSFYTNGWYTPTSGTANQQYMGPNVEIKPDVTPNPTKWSAVTDYYWPRSGYINFFSYASKNAITPTWGASGAGTFAISDYVVKEDDNILIADAVYRATTNTNNVTDTENSNNPTGVPTLFRHVLSQISFKLALGTTEPKKTTETSFEATITEAKLVKVLSTGSLSLTAGADAGSSLNIQPWTPASDGTVVGWTATTATKDITLAPAGTGATNKLTLAAATQTGDFTDYLVNYTVLPQTLSDDLELQIKFDLDYKHGTTVYASEKDLTVSAKLKGILSNATTPAAINSWNMNQRILYKVIIDPVTEVILFDPAVLPWVEVEATHGPVVPVAPTPTTGD